MFSQISRSLTFLTEENVLKSSLLKASVSSTFGSKRWDISGAKAIKYMLKAAQRVTSFIWCAHIHTCTHAHTHHTGIHLP